MIEVLCPGGNLESEHLAQLPSYFISPCSHLLPGSCQPTMDCQWQGRRGKKKKKNIWGRKSQTLLSAPAAWHHLTIWNMCLFSTFLPWAKGSKPGDTLWVSPLEAPEATTSPMFPTFTSCVLTVWHLLGQGAEHRLDHFLQSPISKGEQTERRACRPRSLPVILWDWTRSNRTAKNILMGSEIQ